MSVNLYRTFSMSWWATECSRWHDLFLSKFSCLYDLASFINLLCLYDLAILFLFTFSGLLLLFFLSFFSPLFLRLCVYLRLLLSFLSVWCLFSSGFCGLGISRLLVWFGWYVCYVLLSLFFGLISAQRMYFNRFMVFRISGLPSVVPVSPRTNHSIYCTGVWYASHVVESSKYMHKCIFYHLLYKQPIKLG